jgi:hypothetical protein
MIGNRLALMRVITRKCVKIIVRIAPKKVMKGAIPIRLYNIDLLDEEVFVSYMREGSDLFLQELENINNNKVKELVFPFKRLSSSQSEKEGSIWRRLFRSWSIPK